MPITIANNLVKLNYRRPWKLKLPAFCQVPELPLPLYELTLVLARKLNFGKTIEIKGKI